MTSTDSIREACETLNASDSFTFFVTSEREAAMARVILKRAARRIAKGMNDNPADAIYAAWRARQPYTGPGAPLLVAYEAYRATGDFAAAVEVAR